MAMKVILVTDIKNVLSLLSTKKCNFALIQENNVFTVWVLTPESDAKLRRCSEYAQRKSSRVEDYAEFVLLNVTSHTIAIARLRTMLQSSSGVIDAGLDTDYL